MALRNQKSRRTAFLSRLRGKGTYRYSRYGGLPLRYGGGKSLAVGHVVEQLPAGLTRLVSPFVGGASVEIACANELGVEVTAYDVFDILTGYWQVQLDSPEALADCIARWQPTKETYASVKQRLKGHWDRSEPIEDQLELAAHYWFNHNLSYGPGFLGWMSRIYEEPERYQRLLDKVRTFRCPGLSVEQGDFADVLPQHRDDFLYCDPPYYLDGDSRMFRGIYPQRNFPVHHRGFDHGLLRDLLAEHRGGFVLSYNDCSAVREMYADCRIVEVGWQYTLGQGEKRIGKHRLDRGTTSYVKGSHELLIIAEAAKK
ncbi:MAG: DNA adenine methylase [Chloroflexota bacterium]|nr:DNA adenine methylase [Chloroflexota bacterium]MDE3267190.1 DNA adenine methylase [Chloroflexota bacterium]